MPPHLQKHQGTRNISVHTELAHRCKTLLQHEEERLISYLCVLRPRRGSFGSREVMRGDSVTHQLTKKLQHLKKKIKQFEEQFEKERNYKVKNKHILSACISVLFYLFISPSINELVIN